MKYLLLILAVMIVSWFLFRSTYNLNEAFIFLKPCSNFVNQKHLKWIMKLIWCVGSTFLDFPSSGILMFKFKSHWCINTCQTLLLASFYFVIISSSNLDWVLHSSKIQTKLKSLQYLGWVQWSAKFELVGTISWGFMLYVSCLLT